MKRIINGKKYDTDTAKWIADASYSYAGDFNHYEEALYQKKNGEFFLAGSGGPASKYSHSSGLNCWSGGSDIIPLELDEAQLWCETNMTVGEYESVFGKIEE
jgi:hypothetical protein